MSSFPSWMWLAAFGCASCAETRLDLGGNAGDDADAQAIAGPSVSAVALGFAHSCAVTSERVSCLGANAFGQTGSRDMQGGTCTPCVQEAFHLGGEQTPEELRAGGEVTCLVQGGRASCLGRNSFGQLGRGLSDENPHPTPIDTGLSGVDDVGIGRHHVCVVSAAQVWCAGLGHLGQLGFEPDDACAVPDDVLGEDALTDVAPCATRFTRVPDLDRVARLVVRRHTTCAVHGDGRVSCFGEASPLPGMLSTPLVPSEVAVLRDLDFALGWDHGCLLAATGRPECWGAHTRGQLGFGEMAPSGCGETRCPDPVPLLDSGDARAVVAGDGFSCMLIEQRVQCWGDAGQGRLGVSSPDDLQECSDGPCSNVPRDVRFEGTSDPPEGLIAGDRHTCALTRGNTASCWGNNQRAQIARHRGSRDDAVTLPSTLYGL